MRRAGEFFVDDAMDLVQLLHEVVLRVEPASGVDQEVTGISGLSSDNGVVGHRRGISAVFGSDDRNVNALAPKFDLFDGGGAKCVASSEEDRLLSRLEQVSKFSGGGGFAGPVHADNRDDGEAGRIV